MGIPHAEDAYTRLAEVIALPERRTAERSGRDRSRRRRRTPESERRPTI
jgi:hypothetical protein